MKVQELTDNVEIIQTLSDYPNTDGGLTASQLKGKFDEGSKIIKGYINEKLVPTINENCLVVTINGNDASATAPLIHAHIQNGGVVILNASDEYIALACATDDAALFARASGSLIESWKISNKGSVIHSKFSAASYDELEQYISALMDKTVLVEPQEFTDEQKIQAVENLGLSTLEVALTYNQDGSLVSSCTPFEILVGIAQGRNILCRFSEEDDFFAFAGITSGAAVNGQNLYAHFKSPHDDTGAWTEYIIDPKGAVTIQAHTPILATPQTLSPEQQAQARKNIGAMAVEDMPAFPIVVTLLSDGTADISSEEIYEAYKAGSNIQLDTHTNIIPLTMATREEAVFTLVLETGEIFIWRIHPGRTYTFEETSYVNQEELEAYAKDTVRYTKQTLSPEQQAQARENIGAVDHTYVNSNFANAIKGTATGNPVCITDSSPVEHEIAVKLTSETITDFSSVTVTKRGFNWFDQDTRFAQLGYVKQEDGSWLGDTYHGTLTTPPVQVQGAVYIQATVKNTGLRGVPLSLKASYTDGTIQTLIQVTDDMTEFTRLKGVSKEDKTLQHIQITYGGDATVTKGAFYICNVMMSYADGEYVPYTAETQVFASNADGTVKGIAGKGEPMTLTTDTQGVTITAEYNRDTNKVIAAQEATISELKAALTALLEG